MSELLSWMPALLYGWAATAHWRRLLAASRGCSAPTWPVGAVAVGGHLVQVVALAAAAGRLPVGTMWGALSLSVLVFAGSYLLLERLAGSSSLGTPFFLLSSFASLLVSLNEAGARTVIVHRAPALFTAHVALGVSGIGLLAASGLLAGAWLLLYRLLRDRRFGHFERNMPDLASLDRLFRMAAGIGTGLLAAGALLGLVWMRSAGIPLSMVAWKSGTVLFALVWNLAIPLSPRFPGFSPRRAAWIGFTGLVPLLLSVWAGVRVG